MSKKLLMTLNISNGLSIWTLLSLCLGVFVHKSLAYWMLVKPANIREGSALTTAQRNESFNYANLLWRLQVTTGPPRPSFPPPALTLHN
jgi:hypothetical protein